MLYRRSPWVIYEKYRRWKGDCRFLKQPDRILALYYHKDTNIHSTRMRPLFDRPPRWQIEISEAHNNAQSSASDHHLSNLVKGKLTVLALGRTSQQNKREDHAIVRSDRLVEEEVVWNKMQLCAFLWFQFYAHLYLHFIELHTEPLYMFCIVVSGLFFCGFGDTAIHILLPQWMVVVHRSAQLQICEFNYVKHGSKGFHVCIFPLQ